MSNERARRALMPLLLAASLTGCAASLPPPSKAVQPPQRPEPPAELMEPPSSGKWSQSVLELLSKWRKLLTPAKDS